jgi:hypothetical protein
VQLGDVLTALAARDAVVGCTMYRQAAVWPVLVSQRSCRAACICADVVALRSSRSLRHFVAVCGSSSSMQKRHILVCGSQWLATGAAEAAHTCKPLG